MDTIMTKLKEIFDEFGEYPKNINCDQQFDKKEFIDFFTSKGTKLWFSEKNQPHKNSLIERFWRTLSLILQRARNAIKNFDWVKELPNVVDNYNNTWHRTLNATPKQVIEGKKENPVKPKFVESQIESGRQSKNKKREEYF